jgi:hypothetical protein
MPRRNPPRRTSKRPTAASATDLDALFDALDTAALANDADQVSRLTKQLWAARRQVPEVLTQRLVAGRARLPGLALELLIGFGPQAHTYLRRIADSTEAPDIVRFGAQRRAGWPERGQAKRRRAFLETLADPRATLVEAVHQGTGGWLADSEVLAEVLAYLAALSSEQRADVAARVVSEVGKQAAWLFRALLHVPDPSLQRYALTQLVHWRDTGAAGAMMRLAQTARAASLRNEARAAAQRLQLRPTDQDESAGARVYPPVSRAYLSLIDGDGGQVVILVREWGPGAYLFVDTFHNEASGIKSVLGVLRIDGAELEEMFAGFEAQDLALVAVELAALRGALAVGAEANAAQRRTFPPEFELWEPLYHDSDPPPADEAIIAPELDDAPYTARADLVKASDRLADHPWFASWGFDVESMFAAMAESPQPSGLRLTDRQYRPIIAALFDDDLRTRWRARLQRQAWLLDRAGDVRARDLALASAAQLATSDAAVLAKNPLLRKLVERSILQLTVSTIFGLG